MQLISLSVNPLASSAVSQSVIQSVSKTISQIVSWSFSQSVNQSVPVLSFSISHLVILSFTFHHVFSSSIRHLVIQLVNQLATLSVSQL